MVAGAELRLCVFLQHGLLPRAPERVGEVEQVCPTSSDSRVGKQQPHPGLRSTSLAEGGKV